MGTDLLRVKDLRTHFFTRRGVVKAVDGLSFDLRHGECLCLVGESGCGKTVTAHSLLRLIDSPPGKILSGEIEYGGIDLARCSNVRLNKIRGGDIAMIFQDAQSALNPVLTIGEQILEQMRQHGERADLSAKATGLLREVGLPDPERVLKQYPHQLSGGMRQRAMIAMSLSCNPKIIIADEPTTAVDVTVKAQIISILDGLKTSRQMSLLFITHDLGIVAEIGDRAIVMYAGQECESGPVSEIIDAPKHPYTIGLIECLPDLAAPDRRLTPIPGMPPDPTDLPPGCLFHPRCSKAMPVCTVDAPLCKTISPQHQVRCHLYDNL